MGAAILAPALVRVLPTQAAAGGPCELHALPSGLEWCDLQEGDGPVPLKGALYKAHYRAFLGSSGAEFDSSYARSQPLIFKAGEREIMEAWDIAILGTQGLPPLRQGGKRRIVVPPGPLQQQGTKSLVWMVGLLDALEDAGVIINEELPASDLVFEIELLKRKPR